MAKTNATNRTTRQEHSPSASFNGSSTGITLGFKANSTGFTIAAWIKVRRFTSGDRIFDQQDSGPSKGFAVLMPVTASDRSLYFSVFGDSSEEANIKIALNIWEWTHIAISFEPNSAKFYKNGVLAGTDTSVSLGDSVTNLVIGKNASSAANYFNGLMKDFVVYDRVLSLAEVENVRDGIVSQTNLKCYLPLSSDLADISVNGNDGTGTAVFTYTNDSPFYDAVGLNMYAPLKSSLLLERGVGYPTWSRATKAWGFNELGYLEELASGCAFFGGARLVRNTVSTKSEDITNAAWVKTAVTTPSVNTVVCSAATSAQSLYTNNNYTAALGSLVQAKARITYVDTAFVQFRAGGGLNGSAYVNFDLVNGSYSLNGTGGIAASMTAVSAGVYDCTFTYQITSSIADTALSISFINNMAATRAATFIGDGVKSFIVTRAQVCDVTNYDASYVPEYVSVGVEASPYFGAGIDGAKYFETDWQGAPIAAANLLGFRREAAATNNLLQCRNTTQNAWGSPANGGVGSELLTNGAFGSATDWTRTGAAYWSVSGGVLNLNAADSSASYYDNSQTYALLVTGKQYVVEFDYVHTSGSAPTVTLRGTDGKPLGNSTGRKTLTITCGSSVAGYGIRIGTFAAAVGTIDNLTIKEAPVQCAQTAIGIDGVANTATTLAAAVADAIILQPITLSSADRCASAYVKRRTGTGTISFTQDGGSTWTDITSQIDSSTWSRVQITATLANPSVGFKISTSGDAIDVDCVQNEAGSVATSPIVTTTAAVTRNADSLTYQTAGNIDATIGTLFCEYSVYEQTSAAPRAIIGLSTSAATANALLLHATSVATSSLSSGDGTTVFAKTGLGSAVNTKRKAAVSWGTGRSLTAEGLATQSGGFSGTLPSVAIAPGAYTNGTFPLNGYIGPVAIYNYQITDAELQALTT